MVFSITAVIRRDEDLHHSEGDRRCDSGGGVVDVRR